MRTTTDPYVGRLSLVRVFSGTLRVDETVHVSGHLGDFVGHEVAGHPAHDDDERVGPLASPFIDGHRPRGTAIAGDLALVSKLTRAETSDTLSSPDRPAVVAPWLLPEPQLPVAIRAATKSDEDKLAGALQRLVAEDVTMRLDHSAETEQVVLWTMGQAHVDDLIGQLADRYGVTVTAEPYRTALRETFVRRCTVQGRHVKQSGGHGQYAVCSIEIEPLPRGSGFEFVDKVVGGAVPRQFIPSVEKGARLQLEKGLLTGHPVVDVRVTLTDGKAHSVDSSDVAFQTAAALALKEAANESTMALLEPIDRVDITIADEYLGAVMSDLRGRRGQVLGTEPADGMGPEGGWTVVHAEVPQAELSRYPIDLRSVSHGTGSFVREPLRHDLLPADKAARPAQGLSRSKSSSSADECSSIVGRRTALRSSEADDHLADVLAAQDAEEASTAWSIPSTKVSREVSVPSAIQPAARWAYSPARSQWSPTRKPWIVPRVWMRRDEVARARAPARCRCRPRSRRRPRCGRRAEATRWRPRGGRRRRCRSRRRCRRARPRAAGARPCRPCS